MRFSSFFKRSVLFCAESWKVKDGLLNKVVREREKEVNCVSFFLPPPLSLSLVFFVFLFFAFECNDCCVCLFCFVYLFLLKVFFLYLFFSFIKTILSLNLLIFITKIYCNSLTMKTKLVNNLLKWNSFPAKKNTPHHAIYCVHHKSLYTVQWFNDTYVCNVVI